MISLNIQLFTAEMSLFLIDKLHKQARNASKDDIKKIAANLKDGLRTSDKSADTLSFLRQLFFVLQATEGLTNSIEENLIYQLVNLIDTKEKGKVKDGLLCLRIVQELLPLEGDDRTVQTLQQLAPSYFHLQVHQCNTDENLGSLLSSALSLIRSPDAGWEVQRKSLVYLTNASTEHGKFIWTDLVQSTNDRVGFWLKDVGLFQAPNPYTSNPFRKDQNNLVTEVDGTPSTNFFTVLNIGQYYTPDQQMNICSFSVLYQWLSHSHMSLTSQPQLAIKDHLQSESFKLLSGRSSPMTASPAKQPLKRSPSSPTATTSPQIRLSPSRALSIGSSRQGTPSKALFDRATTPVGSLTSLTDEKAIIAESMYDGIGRRTLDYCLRILDQCDRKAKVSSDTDLQHACIIESVKLMDLVCQIDDSQISKSFMELKRLCLQISTEQSIQNHRLYLHIVQFLLNHSSAVAYDPNEELITLFHRILSRNFNSHAVGFDIVLFILDNLEYLCHECNIMATFFPNILKLLAWNPHTYVTEFVEMVPAMMSEGTSLEVFHSLLDLPCMTIALEVMEKMKSVDLTTINVVSSQQEPTNSVEAFKNAMYRPMFNFFTRAEGGHGDTINRLDKFHAALVDMLDHPRVLVCYQVVPVLLRVWFNVILEEGSMELVTELIPVVMERISLIFGIPEYQKDIKRIITENMTLLIKKYPKVILTHRTDITEFLSNIRNITGWEDFFCLLVFAVGEYISTVYGDCTADMVQHVYETLEVLTYEVISVTANTPEKEAPYTVKLVTTLISALSKLATRCQDLIPRAILCLTKVINQHNRTANIERGRLDILVNRAQELLNVLRIPSFASVVLNPVPNLEAIQVHRDRTSLTSVIRTTNKMLSGAS